MNRISSKESEVFALQGELTDFNDRQPAQQLATSPIARPKKLNKRAISGNSVVCACSMQLPNADIFNQLRVNKKGFLTFNARGGALYISPQFSERTVDQLFNPGEWGTIKNFKLYPQGIPEIAIGQIKARFLFFTHSQPFPGMVMRFGDLTDRQLDMMNALILQLPKVGPSEHAFIQRALKKKV